MVTEVACSMLDFRPQVISQYNREKGRRMNMDIELTELGETKRISLQNMGARKNAGIFLLMLNYFDPFVKKDPIWLNKIAWLAEVNVVIPIGNASAATV